MDALTSGPDLTRDVDSRTRVKHPEPWALFHGQTTGAQRVTAQPFYHERFAVLIFAVIEVD